MTERDLIASIVATLPSDVPRDLVQGVGDDCAVIRKNEKIVWLISVDTLVESVHYDKGFHPPELLGRKVVSVNVSDIAAMGGSPLFVLLSAGLPPHFDPDWVRAFHSGLSEACAEYGCFLIGGDTVAHPGGAVFTLTIIGEMAEQQVLYRNGARVGDTVFVSGQLGLAAAGLALLSQKVGAERQDFAPLFAKHLNPLARVELGKALAKSGLVHAMMDSSDGLATDLAHICTSSALGACLFVRQIPISPVLKEAAQLLHADPLDWALRGGEDFELIFTASPEKADEIMALAQDCQLPVHPVGTMEKGIGIRLVQEEADGTLTETSLSYQGYDHFPANGKNS